MTKEEYFNDHIPHRVNILLTFKERFMEQSPYYVNPEDIRDLFRCSKDMSMMMVRFLLGELGINLTKKNTDISEKTNNEFVKKLTINELKNDKRYESVLTVLKVANRAVAHIEDIEVDHIIKTELEHPIIFEAIDYTILKVKSNMYEHSKKWDFDKIMKSPNNDMKRKRIKIEK